MANKHELYRKQAIQRGSTLRHHSMNQGNAHTYFDGERRLSAAKKIERKKQREKRKQQFVLFQSLPYQQDVFTDSVARLRSGEASRFDSGYVKAHLGIFVPEENVISVSPTDTLSHI